MTTQFSLFVKDLQSNTVCLTVEPATTLSQVKLRLQERLCIPAAEQLFASLEVCEESATLRELNLGRDSHLQLSGRLRGGKGGFGSLLRGSRKSSQTENDDACRDLSGRRVRVVEAERKLQEWAAGELDRKRERQVAKEERDRLKAEKRAEAAQVDTEDVKNDQKAALSGLQKALQSSMKAGLKRAPAPAKRSPAKKPRYESGSDGDGGASDSSDSESEGAPSNAPAEALRAVTAVKPRVQQAAASALQEAGV